MSRRLRHSAAQQVPTSVLLKALAFCCSMVTPPRGQRQPSPVAAPHLRVGSGVARRRPSGALAWLLRSPLGLYEHDLGWILGHRFAEITHRGRKSGRVFRSMVEVARFDPRTREVVVVSAWRGRTDWYRNIQVEPALQIRSGRLRFVPVQRSLSADETFQEMESYAHRNRLAARLMPWLFGIDMRSSTPDTYAAVSDFFKGVSFRPGR